MSLLNNGNTFIAILSGDVLSITAKVLHSAQNETSLGRDAPRFQSCIDASFRPDIADMASGLTLYLLIVVLNHF